MFFLSSPPWLINWWVSLHSMIRLVSSCWLKRKLTLVGGAFLVLTHGLQVRWPSPCVDLTVIPGQSGLTYRSANCCYKQWNLSPCAVVNSAWQKRPPISCAVVNGASTDIPILLILRLFTPCVICKHPFIWVVTGTSHPYCGAIACYLWFNILWWHSR